MTTRILVGDAVARLRELPDAAVHACVTSPPYWSQRDYGHPEQIGLEATPELYIAALVAVFREVRRVLRPEGTLWLNLGDSYVSTGWSRTGRVAAGGGNADVMRPALAGGARADLQPARARGACDGLGLKPKDLIGMPWMVARALQQPYYAGRIKSAAERAWLAGFIDGEGTISFVERDRGERHTPTHDVRVFVTNCDDAPLRHFQSLCGGRVGVHNGGAEGRFGARTCFRWQLGTHDSAMLLREIYPFLRTKRKQAALIWSLYTTLRHKNGHARTPADVMARRREIADMVRRLNRGVSVDLPTWVDEPPSATEPGWWLRSDIIWAKGNPTPESTRDRPTKAHEYVFLLSQREQYFYDADAVRERHADPRASKNGRTQLHGQAALRPRGNLDSTERWYNPLGRNKRSVWSIPTEPFGDGHFAVMPTALVTPCVAASTSERGCCSACGAPIERVVDRARTVDGEPAELPAARDMSRSRPSRAQGIGHGRIATVALAESWRPTCGCAAGAPVPCTVLDPFGGSGTVALVAARLGRHATLIELNPEYAAIAERRTAQEGIFAGGSPGSIEFVEPPR